MDLKTENLQLKKELELMKIEIEELKERLKKYTFNNSHKTYKEKNKEKIKEYAKIYYEKKKLEKEKI